MSPWRLITTFGAAPGFNMGLDEALLLGDGPPTLRLYTWSPDTLSLGYFQRYADVPRADEASVVVRRITGGGAIHHTRELTFSLTCDQAHPLYRGAVRGSYARVHAAVAAALRTLDLDVRMRGEEARLESDTEGTGMCFHASTPLDLCWGGRKGVGSAQRRKDGRVLHHGSIKLGDSRLETGVATAPAETNAKSFAPRLLQAFSEVLGLRTRAGVPDPAEVERAKELGERYLDPAFVRRR